MKSSITGYNLVSLSNMISQIGEDRTKSILLNFYCPLNEDVEYFIRHKAIEFSKQDLSKTHLVVTSYQGNPVLIAYFTLSAKTILIPKKVLSNRLQKRINKFATYSTELQRYLISAPLIAQLGKNYQNGYNQLITGDELLKITCDKVQEVQDVIGCKIAYLECEDSQSLIDFYERNGFVIFGKRNLDRDESERINGKYLIQMLRYF
ncbi:hypothetical protein [Tindallia californiensis]|uniref:N-acetyltransferase domain-containing protein n=1 Tax=Tindallia californiensis TaxID=159292 RepID=A0A1H3QPG7_9FIRM|nr:hypothetical protein [Tindallia californiensis]SDZ15220.1 hypothetical protein SAMN05192546_11032 [Tindallia californiensis]